jgi:P27 family predicted phage terminase small subunit
VPTRRRHPNLKIVEGRGPGRDGKPRDSGGRPIDQALPFRRLAPEKPATLDARAAAHWDLIVPELSRLDMLKPTDVGGLTILCETWSLYQRAQQQVRKEGLLAKTSEGTWRRHPALMIAEVASREYRAWANEFGLSPAAEGTLKPRTPLPPEGEVENPFA